jgi:hypothetical protein
MARMEARVHVKGGGKLLGFAGAVNRGAAMMLAVTCLQKRNPIQTIGMDVYLFTILKEAQERQIARECYGNTETDR